MPLEEITELFIEHNSKNEIYYGEPSVVAPLTAVVVFKASNFKKEYSLEERSYRIQSNNGKRFFPTMLGSSIYGTSLDGSDKNVRLDYYRWEIDYCYLEDTAESTT